MRILTLIILLSTLLSCSTSELTFRTIARFGNQMAREGLWREAEFRWKQALEKDPGNFMLLNNLAIAAEVRGDREEAKRLYEAALKLNPDSSHIKRNYEKFKRFIDSEPAGDR